MCGLLMAVDILQRIRGCIEDHAYALSEHAYDEMDADSLDVLDVESAVLTGKVDRQMTDDPRGIRYVVIGTACDLTTQVGVVVRFVEGDQLLVITVYEIE